MPGMTTFDSSKHPREVSGQFKEKLHSEDTAVTLHGESVQDLEKMSNDAARAVYEAMGDVDASNDGAGMYLLIDTSDGEALHSGCPTLASDDPDAKWYVESSDGNFFKEHPDFKHDADPAQVAEWIREMSASYEAGLNANRAALKVQELLEGAKSHNEGAGIYLEIPTTVEDEPLVSGCPVEANDDPKATWYVETGAGDFHEDHPTFTHDTDPEKVAAWINEVKSRFESSQS